MRMFEYHIKKFMQPTLKMQGQIAIFRTIYCAIRKFLFQPQLNFSKRPFL